MFSNDRDQLRKVFFDTWRKHQQQIPLEPLEAQLLDVILLHPEYHAILARPQDFQAEDFAENNPFLHLSLHLAIREQYNTDRPFGVKKIYALLCGKFADIHSAEHQMMDCLAQTLWEAQSNNSLPDEKIYLQRLQNL